MHNDAEITSFNLIFHIFNAEFVKKHKKAKIFRKMAVKDDLFYNLLNRLFFDLM